MYIVVYIYILYRHVDIYIYINHKSSNTPAIYCIGIINYCNSNTSILNPDTPELQCRSQQFGKDDSKSWTGVANCTATQCKHDYKSFRPGPIYYNTKCFAYIYIYTYISIYIYISTLNKHVL